MNRTITIKGIGKLSLKPDQTVVSPTLKTVRADYDKAMDEAAKHLEQLRSAIAEIGFTKDDLKTTSFDVGTSVTKTGITSRFLLVTGSPMD